MLLNVSLQLKTNTPQAVAEEKPIFILLLFTLLFLYSRVYAANLFISRNVCMQVARRRDGLGQNRIIQQPGGCVSVIGFSVSFIRPDNNTFVFENPPPRQQPTLFHNDDNSTHTTRIFLLRSGRNSSLQLYFCC